MQLFGLVNSLLASTRAYHGDHALAQRALTIKRYAVIPLSPSTGLIGILCFHPHLNLSLFSYSVSSLCMD